MAALAAIATSAALAQNKPKEIEINGVLRFQDTPLEPDGKWHVHDPARPQPPIVTPGASFSENAKPPADAIVLFDGTGLSHWRDKKTGGDALWKIEKGVMVSASGDIVTTNQFADIQLHLEFCEPTPPKGDGQGRGNSGVFFHGALRGSGSRLLPEPDLRGRRDGRTLRPASGARQRLPSTRRMADL